MDEHIPAWAQEIRERMVRIETKLDQYNGIREVAFGAKSKSDSCAEDIKEIKGSLTWLWRTIATAIIGMVVAAFSQLRGGN